MHYQKLNNNIHKIELINNLNVDLNIVPSFPFIHNSFVTNAIAYPIENIYNLPIAYPIEDIYQLSIAYSDENIDNNLNIAYPIEYIDEFSISYYKNIDNLQISCKNINESSISYEKNIDKRVTNIKKSHYNIARIRNSIGGIAFSN